MTCIVAFRYKKDTIIAGDKMGSDTITGSVMKKPKVFRNYDFLIGYEDSFRLGQILQFNWFPPERKMEQDIDSYLYVDVVRSLKECFEMEGYGEEGKSEFGTFILCYEDRIIEVQSDLSFLEPEQDIVCLGSGGYHAVGAIEALLDYEKNPETILKKAFKIVSDNVVSVSSKFDFIKASDT
jgi:ATP-dependent protease HslVU (ClpYQ) peptidase subunit